MTQPSDDDRPGPCMVCGIDLGTSAEVEAEMMKGHVTVVIVKGVPVGGVHTRCLRRVRFPKCEICHKTVEAGQMRADSLDPTGATHSFHFDCARVAGIAPPLP